MRIAFRSDVPAPLDQVRYVLDVLDEYPAWGSAIRRTPAGMRWTVELPAIGTRALDVAVVGAGDTTRVRFGRRSLLCLDLDVELAAAGSLHTEVRIATSVSGPLSLLATRAVVTEIVDRFCSELGNRARWLPQAPDTAYIATVLGAPPRRGQNASLEQLKSCARELEGGIFVIDGGSSCCLLDLARSRFLRAEPGSDLAQLVTFAHWPSFERVVCDGQDVVIVPGAGAAPIRIRPRSGSSGSRGHAPAAPAVPYRAALRAGPKSVPA